jgi:hypothetical protein
LKRKDTTELRGSLIIAYRKSGRILFYPKGQVLLYCPQVLLYCPQVLLYCLCIHILVLHPINQILLQSNTPTLLYQGRTVPGSRNTRDRTSSYEAFQILIAYRGGVRTLPSQCQSVNPNHYTIPCWKTMEYYRTSESNTQTTTSARRNY